MKNLFLGVLVYFLLVFALPGQANAQRGGFGYETSAGIRLSPFYGFSVKHFYSGSSAVEGILASRWNDFKITGLYEKHAPAFGEPGLQFYYGGGAHLGFLNGRYYDDRHYGGSRAMVGIDGIIGLEYVIQERDVPLNVSLDWKPVFDFAPYAGLFGGEVGLTVRYIFR